MRSAAAMIAVAALDPQLLLEPAELPFELGDFLAVEAVAAEPVVIALHGQGFPAEAGRLALGDGAPLDGAGDLPIELVQVVLDLPLGARLRAPSLGRRRGGGADRSGGHHQGDEDLTHLSLLQPNAVLA